MPIPSHADLLREYLEQLSQPGGESRLPPWADWVRMRSVGGALAMGAVLTLAACDDSDSGNGNPGGAAGMSQVAGSGGTNMTALYAAPMTGGTTATGSGGTNMTALYAAPMTGGTTATGSGGMNMTALYAAPMTGGATAAGGVSAGTRYAVPLDGQGGSASTTSTNTGGSSMVAIYSAPMEKTLTPPQTGK